MSKKSTTAKKAVYKHPRAQFSFRRQILPPLLGVLVMVGVAGFMNGEWISAQVYYHYHKPTVSDMTAVSNVHLDPTAPTKLSIASIRVDAPVVNVKSAKEGDILMGLRDGVVRLPGGADFGQSGNVVLFGHSSGRPLAPGNYKFVFTLLNKVEPGQLVVVDYKGTRYIYKISSTEVVLPTDVAVLNQKAGHNLTLITCSPVGSNTHRLIVHAEQISPKPDNSAPVKTGSTPAAINALPAGAGSDQSLWQRVRGLF